ncbi:ABC transporter substrate-binding protein [Streptomyces violaceusniger]|uniref:ABC transporter substrate-binding protein n=1 Tax=Streptomyces violaceusniger TaxID=68280 RepID=UPI00342CD4D0
MARRNIKAPALGAAMSFALAGCVGGSSDTSASGKPTTLTIGMSNAPQSLAANTTIGGGSLTYYTAVYDSLLLLKPDGSPAPGLADKWGHDDARTTLTLHLRPGVRFSDGHAFDATAAKANLERNTKAGFNAVTASRLRELTTAKQRSSTSRRCGTKDHAASIPGTGRDLAIRPVARPRPAPPPLQRSNRC